MNRFGSRKLPSDLQGLVDDYRPWRGAISQKLSHACAQDVAVHRRHPVHLPVLRVLLNQVVHATVGVHGHVEEVFGEVARLGIYLRPLAPKSAAHLLRRLLAHIPLEEHLQTEFACFTSRAHLTCLAVLDRKSTRLNSSHMSISYAVFCLKKKKKKKK